MINKLNGILAKLMQASSDIVLPPPPTGPFIYDAQHPAPKPKPKPCDPSRARWAKCLYDIPVNNENDRCIATLRRYADNWLLNKCSLVDSLCQSASTTPPAGQSGPQILAAQCKECHCRQWNNFEKNLAALISNYCKDQAPTGPKKITCAALLKSLKQICVTRNDGINLCSRTYNGCSSPIPMSGECGLE